MAHADALPAAPTAPAATRVWSALGAIYLIWGATYLFIRIMVRSIPPVIGVGVRFTVAGAIMLAIVAASGGARRLLVGWRALGSACAVGALLVAGGNGLVTIAEREVPSGLAALLISSVPLWLIVLRALARDRPARATVYGVLVGLAGLAVLLLAGNRPEEAPLGWCLVVVGAALAWAVGTHLGARLRLPGDPLVSTAWQLTSGGLLMLAIGLPSGELSSLGHASAGSWLALVYLVFVGSIVAFSCYSWLLRNAPVSQVATYAFVNPVVAVALGAVFLGEDLPWTTVLGTAVIVAAVATIVRTESRRPR